MDSSELFDLAHSAIIKTSTLRNTRVYGRPEWLRVTKNEALKGTKNGKPCDVYSISQSPNPGEGFLSYIVDYGDGQLNYAVLGKEAQFCFTITLNGCSFAMGTPAPDGTVIVSHTNMKPRVANKEDMAALGTPDVNALVTDRLKGRQVQADAQLEMVKDFHRGGGSYLGPEAYRKEEENITLFGVFRNSEWRFYYQVYAQLGAQATWKGFHTFANHSTTF